MNRKYILAVLMGLGVQTALAQTADTSVTVVQPRTDSLIRTAFGKSDPRLLSSSVTVIKPEELLQYDNMADVLTAISGRVPGLIGSQNIRGLGNALVVIDGIPRPATSITIQEVAEITILRDVNSAVLYGVQANNGVIQITTKRGAPGGRKIAALVEYGVSDPVSFPNYLGAADYMELYNEALTNDGLATMYTPEAIAATRAGTNPMKYPDENYYNSDFLKKVKPQSRVALDFSGGNDNAQYYLNLGWTRAGSILKMGEAQNIHSDRLNMRSNLNFRINKFIRSNVDIVGVFDINKGVIGDFWNDASTLRPNAFTPRIDTNMVADKKLVRTATVLPGGYLLGGNSLYRNNIYGNLLYGGYSTQMNSSVQFNSGIDVDLASITKGLSFRTIFSFDYYSQFSETQTNTYAIWEPSFVNSGGQEIMNISKIGIDRFSGVQGISNTNQRRRFGIIGLLDYNRRFGDFHAFSATMMGSTEKYNETDVFQSTKYSNLGLRMTYAYAGKYVADFSAALVSSAKLPPGHRTGFSPTVSLGWLLSEEGFLRNSETIDFLKLKVSAGIINTDKELTRYYAYEDIYTSSSSFSWNDLTRSNNITVLSNRVNSNLFFEKRKELTVGLEAAFLQKSLWVDANVFLNRNSDLVVQRINGTPDYLGGIYPYENYGEDKSTGFELGLRYGKNYREFGFELGLNAAYIRTEVIKRDERWAEPYLYRAGQPLGATFGLEALGLFKDDNDIKQHAVQQFGAVQPGDIKYKDQNGDGLVDANDEVNIGNGNPDLYGGLSIQLRYKRFSLFTMLTGNIGSDRFYNNAYYHVFGDRKYSEVVRDRWTPATAETATYPRLTSRTNSNNFRNSDFWLYNNTAIQISRLQLNYALPATAAKKIFMKDLGMYIRASNLANFTSEKDKMELNIGTEPQYRNYAIGVKAQF